MIDPHPLPALHLGADIVRRLLPHRPPLLLVDAVEGFSSDTAAVEATKLVSASDPVFAGHFPDLWLWPGAYTIEGLAQTCALVGALVYVDAALRSAGRGTATDLLADIERGMTHHFGNALSADDATLLKHAATASTGLLASVDVKLLRPVFAGRPLTYRAVRTHTLGPMVRFDVEATVASEAVARGTLTMAIRAPA